MLEEILIIVVGGLITAFLVAKAPSIKALVKKALRKK